MGEDYFFIARVLGETLTSIKIQVNRANPFIVYCLPLTWLILAEHVS